MLSPEDQPQVTIYVSNISYVRSFRKTFSGFVGPCQLWLLQKKDESRIDALAKVSKTDASGELLVSLCSFFLLVSLSDKLNERAFWKTELLFSKHKLLPGVCLCSTRPARNGINLPYQTLWNWNSWKSCQSLWSPIAMFEMFLVAIVV